ncbi:MAG: hypothetical protein K8E24_003035 [Methanobacterium paludis]|nr:hypothetical protein [Methanobacterium paludis]
MSDFSGVSDISLKLEWIEVSKDVKNLQTLKERFPEREDIPLKLRSKESLQEMYKEELDKRGLSNGRSN